MADQKSPEQKTTEPAPADARMVPGGSFKSARKAIGMNGLDHYTQPPAIKADLPDLSDTPGWNIFPKS